MVRVRLENYDWIVVNTSGGKDSQTMMRQVVRAAEALGIKDRVVAVHAEIEEEWPGVKELAQAQAEFYGIRFEVVKRKQGSLLRHVLDRHETLIKKGKTETAPWMSSEQRWCQSDHKRGQVSTLLTKLTGESRLLTRLTKERRPKTRVRILNCMGMRAGESCSRAKLIPFKLDKNNTNGRRLVHVWLPIFAWTIEQVWEDIKLSGIPHHRAYDLGMGRLSCPFCIFAPRNALLLAGKHNPELLDKYCAVEKQTGFSFRKELPLVEIREALRRGEEPGPITAWEMP